MQTLHAMIVSLPGTWQKMLQQNLEDHPFVEVDNLASGALSALALVKNQNPDFVLIDSSIAFDDVDVLVQNLKEIKPDIQVIVLVDTSYMLKRIRRKGADYAISLCNYEEAIGEVLQKIYKKFENVAKTN